jgi:beta-glucanase (GH16 family)
LDCLLGSESERVQSRTSKFLLTLATAVALGSAAGSAVPSAVAAAPSCGSTQIPKESPATPVVPSQEPPQQQQQQQQNPQQPDKKKPRSKKKTKGKKRSSKKKRSRGKTLAQKAAASTTAYWQCTFSDDFDGSTLDSSKWLPIRTDYSGYTSGPTACFVDSPNNIDVSNGSLKLTARKEAHPFTCADGSPIAFNTQYTSATLSSYGRFTQAYGRFEVRAKISSANVPGLHTAFWLWPEDTSRYGGWSQSGEIDFAELYSQYSDRAIPYIHYNPAAPDPNVSAYDCIIGNPAEYHTYALEWTTTQLKVIYDGRTCLVDTPNPASPLSKPAPFDQPFMFGLTQALGVASNQFDPQTTPLPATTTVDYVRAWS